MITEQVEPQSQTLPNGSVFNNFGFQFKIGIRELPLGLGAL